MPIAQLGETVLRQHADPVTEFDPALAQLLQQMQATMEQAGGVGIAAPQVGVGRQALIIASKPNARYPDAPLMAPMALINPQIEATGGDEVGAWEGCLSVPGLRGFVHRPDEVQVRYQDIDGQWQRTTLTGFPARILLHEYDHLIGKTFLDRVSSTEDLVATSVWERQWQNG
nr:peptide deformylase [Ferrimonas marina]